MNTDLPPNSVPQSRRRAQASPPNPRSALARSLSVCLPLGLLLAAPLVLQATTVIDTFNDMNATNTQTLASLTTPGGLGFSTGYEQNGTSVVVARTNDLAVALTNYKSGQSATAKHWSVAGTTASTGTARRAQSRSVTALGGTIWFSFLASLQNGNGDVALVFNPVLNGSGVNTGNGLRVGVGHPSRPGAVGVGPSFVTGVDNTGLDRITNGVNGAVTASNFAPTNGTAGLVLGRLSSDLATGYPRVDVWYNPDVANEASLPAPTLSFVDTNFALVPTSVTRLGYQVVRSTGGTVNELLDCVKVSDEPTAFDIVYKAAPLPIPLVNVAASVPAGNEAGPSNIVFTITTDRPVTSPLTMTYRLSGVATNGFDGVSSFVNADYTDPNFSLSTLLSSVTIPAGKTNATVTLTVLDDTLAEGDESVVITLPTSADYLLGTASATATILDNNDANVSVQYMFTRTYAPQVWDPHLTATPVNAAGVGGSFSGVYNVSPDAGVTAGGDTTADTEAGALANGDYLSFTLAPVAGYAMTLTNLQFQAIYGNFNYQVPEAASATVFLRSSVDNFGANLASWTLQPDNIIFPETFAALTQVLGGAFANQVGNVEFRLYFYDDSNVNQVGIRIDNLYLNGVTFAAPAGAQQVSLSTNVVNAAEPATPGQFTVVRTGDTTSPLTVTYTVSGTASSGVDFAPLPGSVVIPAGQTNATVTVTPIDDEMPEGVETVTLSLSANAGYGVLAPASATLNLVDDGDVGGLVAWFFNENNNGAGSLAAIATASYKAGSKVMAVNANAGPGLGGFGSNGGSGVGHGYGSSTYQSAPSSLYVSGNILGTNAADALAGNDYASFTIAPVPGNALTLTNFSSWVKLSPSEGQTAWVFLRSSADNFATDLGTITVAGITNGPFIPFTVPLHMLQIPGAVEFRVYVYASRINGADVFRLDDVTLQGSVAALPPGVQQITASATHPNAAEPTTSGEFNLVRYGDATNPLTVRYALSGTASNGLDYALLSGTASFAAGATNVLVPVTVLDDQRPEGTETVGLTLLTDPGYYLGYPLSATVTIADDGDNTPIFTLATTDDNAYERVSALSGAFTLSRAVGNLNAPVTLNFTLGGTAVLGVDYVSSATNAMTFDAGVASQTITITPLNNTLVDGNRTVTLTVQPRAGFLMDPPLSGTVAIVDDETGPATVVWSDNFDAGTSATHYTVTAASDLGMDDYTADFNFDYSTLGVPPAPHSSGTTVGLKLNANANSAAAGVNLYPTGQSLSGNFALRFDLYLSMDPLAAADNELVLFGLNQSGTATNWWSANAPVLSGEGVWATISTRDTVPNIYHLYAATNLGTAPMLVASAGNQPGLFNSPPYATAGRVNNAYDSTNKTWAECELSQAAGIITLKINNNVILQYTNSTPFTNGNVFIGYDDPYASLGTDNCFAIVDNLRLVSLPAVAVQPVIQKLTVSGTTVTIDFTGAATDVAAAFKLQSAGTVNGSYVDDDTASITGSGGSFRATTTVQGAAQFYRIRR